MILYFSLRHKICCCWRNLYRIFAGCTACTVDERRPITLVNSRIAVELFLRRLWYVLTTFCDVFCVSNKVILVESISIPRNYIFLDEYRIDFLIFIIKPKFCRRYMAVSQLMWAWSKIMTQNRHIVQAYYHSHADYSRKWNWNFK